MSAITALGLVPQENYASSSVVPQGDIVAETPHAGTKMPKGAFGL